MSTSNHSTTQGTSEAARTGPFRVLCVCEGNLCRSPVAALLLQDALGPEVEVTSAGTRAVVGAPVAPQMEALLRERSLDSGGSSARQLQAAQLREADLVLTMTKRQRGNAVALAPAVVRRTFTLRALARLLAGVDAGALPSATAERLRQAVPAAAAQRAYVADPRADDIADPYGRSAQDYRRAFAEIFDAVERVRAVLVPGGLVLDGRTTAEDQSAATAGSDSRSGA